MSTSNGYFLAASNAGGRTSMLWMRRPLALVK